MTTLNNAIATILREISSGPRKRSEVTYALRNFRKHVRHEAISHVIRKNLVRLFDDDTKGKGRVAMMVEITNKGRDCFDQMENDYTDTIWR